MNRNLLNVHKICALIFNMKPKERALDNKDAFIRRAVDYICVIDLYRVIELPSLMKAMQYTGQNNIYL